MRDSVWLMSVSACVASVGAETAYPPRIVELESNRRHHLVRLPS